MKAQNLTAFVAGLAFLGLVTTAHANTNKLDHSRSSDARTAETGSGQAQVPTKFNKASSLIGMTVQNEQGEKLGDIKEIVIDMESGKAPYAVITSGGVFGVGEKLLAVPLTAFRTSEKAAGRSDTKVGSARDYLVLSADKDSIRQAQSIGDNWPSVQQPSFGAEPFWKESSDTSRDKDVKPDTSPADPE